MYMYILCSSRETYHVSPQDYLHALTCHNKVGFFGCILEDLSKSILFCFFLLARKMIVGRDRLSKQIAIEMLVWSSVSLEVELKWTNKQGVLG